ncbi:Release factor glutamine methyltransferase [Corynebacterium capitovis DSM 44611]|uniref:peptide chain release factor N(5)-glutamine methyltransferase n=1 Tax=Corynebacterium capitovis TaxID=131081 RepID=UPI000378D758|nr:peptide chain release factor N(5)-glutamine methyltransferase [Corynebacterium capitovis]WKD57844.1 Release factor glutamine methyltransferase [Corynebacterium capitovis DSM 44611]
MKPSKDVRFLVARAAQVLGDAGVATPAVDARLLASALLGVPALHLTLLPPADVPESFEQDYAAAIERRAQREPLQYITGVAPFGGFDLNVGPGVFIPRPETELLARWAVDTLDGVASPTVVDLGTGSGAIAIYIALSRPDARVIAVERSAAAREWAEANGRDLGASISVVPGDMTDPDLLTELSGEVNLVVSNPPYVPESPDLSPEVYFDPHEAVFSGADGMGAIRGLVPVAARLLVDGGALGIEHDDTTSRAVRNVVHSTGAFRESAVVQDMAGRDRFVTASRVKRHERS